MADSIQFGVLVFVLGGFVDVSVHETFAIPLAEPFTVFALLLVIFKRAYGFGFGLSGNRYRVLVSGFDIEEKMAGGHLKSFLFPHNSTL